MVAHLLPATRMTIHPILVSIKFEMSVLMNAMRQMRQKGMSNEIYLYIANESGFLYPQNEIRSNTNVAAMLHSSSKRAKKYSMPTLIDVIMYRISYVIMPAADILVQFIVRLE